MFKHIYAFFKKKVRNILKIGRKKLKEKIY